MRLSDDAKHLLACLAYEVGFLRREIEQKTGHPAPIRYVNQPPEEILKLVGYPLKALPGQQSPEWDPPDADPSEEGPVWNVLFERKYLGEAESRVDTLETFPYQDGGELVSHVNVKFPISVVEWLRLVPQRQPLSKHEIVRQAEDLLEEFEGGEPDEGEPRTQEEWDERKEE